MNRYGAGAAAADTRAGRLGGQLCTARALEPWIERNELLRSRQPWASPSHDTVDEVVDVIVGVGVPFAFRFSQFDVLHRRVKINEGNRAKRSPNCSPHAPRKMRPVVRKSVSVSIESVEERPEGRGGFRLGDCHTTVLAKQHLKLTQRTVQIARGGSTLSAQGVGRSLASCEVVGQPGGEHSGDGACSQLCDCEGHVGILQQPSDSSSGGGDGLVAPRVNRRYRAHDEGRTATQINASWAGAGEPSRLPNDPARPLQSGRLRAGGSGNQ
jgi:hypothetical protein